MTSKLRIVVTGLIAQYPLGGVTWDYFQYVLGLWRMGHDVYYIEDTGQWPYTPTSDGLVKDADYNIRYLDQLMTRFGMGDRWAYRFAWQGQWSGMSDSQRREVLDTADLLINVSGTLERPEEYRGAKVMAYIDSDPVFTQVKLAAGNRYFAKLLETHDVLFSFGELLQDPGATPTPDTGHRWLPTRQPIVLDEWQPLAEHRPVFTTVMNWSAYKPLTHDGRSYGQKDLEFRAFMDLPHRIQPTTLELAAGQGKDSKLPYDLLRHKGWQVVDPMQICPDLDSYRDYVRGSRAEWSVAKHGYVQGQSGWFSCRSACYLAAARPVVVQDTGFSKVLPVGQGLLAFRDLDEAAAAIAAIEADYASHADAAQSLAASHFDSARVLGDLIHQAMAAVA